MHRLFPRTLLAVLIGFILLPVLVKVQSEEDGRGIPTNEWPAFGGNWTNARYSGLAQINPQNVKTLGGAWTFKFEANASTRATPVVKDGVMFVSAGSRLNALDAKTGKVLWSWRPSDTAPAQLEAANIADLLNSGFGIPSPPGVALGEGLVFVGLMDGHVAAVRQKTGELVWSTQLGYEPARTGQAVSGVPLYANGVVLAGLANGDWAFRGKTAALDAKTGKILWELSTIPTQETWPRDPKYGDIWKQGGAGVWMAPTVDPDLGLAFFATGNAVPMFGGEARKGDNLYTACLLAIDVKTGKLRWYYQVAHHDLWDADIAIPPVLYDADVNGTKRKAIAAMRSDGMLFMLDRATGKPVVPVEERKVTQDPYNNTSPTQPFTVGADSLSGTCDPWKDKVKLPFVLDCGGFTPPFLDKHNIVGVSVMLASRVTPMSYSPQTGYFYAQGTSSITRAHRISSDPWFRGNAPMLNDLLPPSVSIVAAFDSRTGKFAWKKELPPGGIGTSGPLTTAGGLMFRGDPNGNFQAYDAKTGDQLWQFQTGIAGARGPAMSYAIDNEQYVAVAMGTGLWAFKLGGTLQPAAPPPGAGGPGRGGAGRSGGPGGAAAGQPTDTIETATLVQSADRGVGARFAVDEHAFNPTRARVEAGKWISFVNNGQVTHTIAALDGSWTTAPIKAAETGFVKITKPGASRYACKEHPWAVGELIVQ
jgi:alcohol dehydrogenase (cytochrome c)